MKNQRIWTVIHELEELEQRTDLEEGLWHISRDTGLFFNSMVRHSGATRILEIGTSSGYSGLFLADAARENSGHLYTCELSEFKINLAKTTFEKAGVAEYVTLIEGDALHSLDSLDGPFDFIFIDAVKEEYVFYLSSVWDKLRVGGLVAADNMLSHKELLIMDAYKGFISLLDDASTVTVPIGSGVELTCKLP